MVLSAGGALTCVSALVVCRYGGTPDWVVLALLAAGLAKINLGLAAGTFVTLDRLLSTLFPPWSREED